jgi:hypothetical protein
MILGLGGEKIATCYLGADTKLVFDEKKGVSVYNADKGHSGNEIMVYYNPSTAESSSIFTMTFTPITTNINTSTWTPVYFSNIGDSYNYNIENKETPYNTIEGSGILVGDENNKVYSV